MQKRDKKKSIISFLFPMLILLVVMISFGIGATNQLEGHIRRSGEVNMTDVMEQMTQICDLQVRSVYKRLERIERNLFPNESRSIVLKIREAF